MTISIIVPAYNEEKVIVGTLKSLISYFKDKPFEPEIIVVDDGSTDQTGWLAGQEPKVKVLQQEKNLGKGAAVKRGMFAATGDLKLFMDADNSTDISELDKFLPYLKEGYQIVVASRALAESQVVPQVWYKALAGKTGNKFIQLLAVPGIKDTQCGFKLFTKEAAEIFSQQTLTGFSFDFEILYLARKLHYRIKEAPVRWVNRSDSKVKLTDYFKTLSDLLKIRFNDLRRKKYD